jgi:hypothetical protein
MIKCLKCGKNMIEKSPNIVFLTDPPQWDKIMWCACGYTENLGRVYEKTEKQILHERWKEANK